MDRVRRERSGGDLRFVRTIVRRLRIKLGTATANTKYIFAEP